MTLQSNKPISYPYRVEGKLMSFLAPANNAREGFRHTHEKIWCRSNDLCNVDMRDTELQCMDNARIDDCRAINVTTVSDFRQVSSRLDITNGRRNNDKHN